MKIYGKDVNSLILEDNKSPSRKNGKIISKGLTKDLVKMVKEFLDLQNYIYLKANIPKAIYLILLKTMS